MGSNFKNLYDLLMLCFNISDIAVITVKGVEYCCIIYDISKSEVTNLLENSLHEDCGYIYKTQIKKINIKNRAYNYYLYNLIKAKH